MKNFAALRRFGYGTNANSFINPNAVEQIVGPRAKSKELSTKSKRFRAAASTPPLGGLEHQRGT
jgi:hypothetical protein